MDSCNFSGDYEVDEHFSLLSWHVRFVCESCKVVCYELTRESRVQSWMFKHKAKPKLSSFCDIVALTYIEQQEIQKGNTISDITRLEHAFMKQMPGVTAWRMGFTVPLLMGRMTLDLQYMTSGSLYFQFCSLFSRKSHVCYSCTPGSVACFAWKTWFHL